jgi:hypothetical protein
LSTEANGDPSETGSIRENSGPLCIGGAVCCLADVAILEQIAHCHFHWARHGAAFLDEKAALASRWLGCAYGNRSTRSVSVARISSGQDEFLLLQSKGTDNVHR